MEGFRDESGLFGVYGHREAAHFTYVGLHGLQERGTDAAGIVTSDGDLLRAVHGTGLVQEVFGGPHLQALAGRHAVGQVSRLGAGVSLAPTAAARLPFVARYRLGQIAVAMAGRFTNGNVLRDQLKADGALYTSTSDAELLLHLVARSQKGTLVNRLVDALWQVEGAFSLLLLTEDHLIAVRDPRGFRPLVRGRLDGATVLASEDGPIRFLGGEIRGEVLPGQMIVVDARGESALFPFLRDARAACIQEPLQLAGPDAHVFGQATWPVRRALGERLAREAPCDRAQVVVALPGAATPIASGYAHGAGKPLAEALVPATTSGRAYAEPPREIADFGARLRWTPVPAVVDGQVVALVVASIGTGEALRKAIRLLAGAGAREIHVRAASPAVIAGCPYGVASATTEELAMPRLGSPLAVSQWLGCDSVAWLSLDSLHAIAGKRADGGRQWCDGCFTTRWPVLPADEAERDQLGLFDMGTPGDGGSGPA